MRPALAGVAAALAAVFAGAAAQACDRSPILVRDALVWSDSGAAQRDAWFEGGRLLRLSPPGAERPGPGVRVIDGRGHTLLPGLIDLHVHLGLPGNLPPPASGEARDHMAVSGRQLLRSGVTSGRVHLMSLEAGAAYRAASADPCAPLPRLQLGGPGLGGGVPTAAGASFWGVASPADAAEKVRRIAAAGFQWVAIHDAHRFASGELAAIRQAGRAAGVRLMASAASAEELAAALQLGPDTVEYLDRTDAPAYPPQLVRRLRVSGAAAVPTLGYYLRMRALVDAPERLEDPSLVEFATEADRSLLVSAARRDLQTNAYVAGSLRAYPTLAAKVGQLRAAGVPVLAGTDVGTAGHLHAGAIWWELEALRTLGGATPGQALAAATSGAARVLREARVGRLRAGDRADFVLYRGRIEAGPFEAGRVLAVARDGVLFVEGGRWVGG